MPEIPSDCKLSPHTTNTKQKNIAVGREVENNASIKAPSNADNKLDIVKEIFKCNMAE